MSQDISHKLLKIRQCLSLSQEELAEKLGVSFATVNRWDNGHSSPRKSITEAIHQLYETALAQQKKAGDWTKQKVILSRANRGKRGEGTGASFLDHGSMEQLLWQSACQMRGEKDTPKFKDYNLSPARYVSLSKEVVQCPLTDILSDLKFLQKSADDVDRDIDIICKNLNPST